MPRKKTSKKPMIITFSAVFVGLLAITLGLPYLSGPAVHHFPSSYTVSLDPWMSYVPPTAIIASEIRVSDLVATGLNVSDIGATFLDIYQIGVRLTPSNVSVLAEYSLPAPSETTNGTEIDIIQPISTYYQPLMAQLESSHIVNTIQYKGQTIYEVYNNITSVKTLTNGYLFFYNGSIFYTQGQTDPLGDIERALDFVLSGSPSLFDNRTIQASLFAAIGTRSNYLSFDYVAFPIQDPSVELGAKIVYYEGGNYYGVFALGYKNLGTAKSHYDSVNKLYQANSGYVLDNYTVLDVTFAQGGVRNQIQGF